jgi:HCOMODA/2-hydroxy-3-carboxy-muconic semialdehyde decarboxylase
LTEQGHTPRAGARELLAGGRALERLGLVDAFGHLSARLADGRVLCTPRGAPGRVASVDALLLFDPRSGELPSAAPPEIHLHLAVLRRRADVHAVCRVHPPSTTAASLLGDALPACTAHGAYLGARVPVHDVARLGRDAATADAVAATLGDGRAVLIRGHGALTCGASVPEAVVWAWFLERAAAAWLAARAAGEPRAMSTEEVGAYAQMTPEALAVQIGRAWEFLLAEG